MLDTRFSKGHPSRRHEQVGNSKFDLLKQISSVQRRIQMCEKKQKVF